VVGVAVAAYGVLLGDRRKRAFAGVLAGGFLILALGDVTPAFRLLYEHVPPFDRLRASARALFYFALYVAMLAAVGVDGLLRAPRRSRALAALLLCVALSLAAAAAWIRSAVPGAPATTARADVEEMLRMQPEERERRIVELAAGSAERAEALRAAATARDLAVTAEAPEPAPESYGRAYLEAMSIDPWLRLRARLVQVRGYGYHHPLREWADPAVGWKQAHAAVVGLLVAAALSAAVAAVLLLAPRTRSMALALAVLGVLEMGVHAWSIRRTFDLRALCPPSVAAFYRAAFYRAAPDDHRVHDATNPNCAMALNVSDIWGYDPFVSARYADYVHFLRERLDPRGKEDSIPLEVMHRSYGMLRLQYVVAHERGALRVVTGPDALPPSLPRLALMRRYAVHQSGRDVLEALDSPEWDPGETVILESEPRPAPLPGPGGATVTLGEHRPDLLTIEADVPSPALLLVTDAYSRGWRARPLPGSEQQSYDVLPANGVLSAIPLAAGRHRLRLEFVPAHFRLGVALSLASLGLLGFAATRGLVRRRR
jgi:hypothetical protein